MTLAPPLIYNVVGARPNFMKMAPVVVELQKRGIAQRLVHTGQHYDAAMSTVFFEELGLPQPDAFLGIGSGTHAQQTARAMIALEEDLTQQKPSMVVVAGDVNSTAAAAMTASKLGIPVAHVEAGLRSFDRSMPEELNRIVTDHLSDLLFTTEESGNLNLQREGIPSGKIHFVGNCMVDSLRRYRSEAVGRRPWEPLGVAENGYALVTLHRPSNVDSDERLTDLLGMLGVISSRLPVLFPVHPRTSRAIQRLGLPTPETLVLLDPLPYITFLGLMSAAKVVLTDSGGIQEETTALGVPCLTLRSNTERPSTVDLGTNELLGDDLGRISPALNRINNGDWKRGVTPPLWDGKAGVRVVDAVAAFLQTASAQAATAP